MSQPQDTHLFSVRRPRETLGGLNLNANAGTAIPQPPSAMKRSSSSTHLPGVGGVVGGQGPSGTTTATSHARSQSASRMSLAPGRPPQPAFQRASSGATGFGGGHRMSFAPMQTPARPPPTTTGLTTGGQTVQRRSSVYSRPSTGGPMMAQASFFVQAPIPAGQVQDRRRLRDRGVQLQLAQELEEYLTQNNFQMDMKHALRPDTLRNPTQKDFNMIFQWLYRRIDPAYVFQKSMDAEVPPILKQLRYPFEKSITKSALMAVGGQNWSTFLGMLHWLMQLATMMDRYANEQYDYACAEEGVDVSSDRIMFRFLRDAYQTWLSSPPGDEEEEDDVEKILAPHIEAMAAEFERGNEQYTEQLQLLEAEHASLTQQIAEAESEAPDLAKQQAYVETLESDLKKFEAWQTNVIDKLKRHEQRNEALKKDMEDWERQLAEATKERAELQTAVDAQGLAVADIDRMNSERERLQTGVESARGRVDEVSQRIRDKEVEASEKLQSLEALVREFNTLCYDVGIREAEYELAVQIPDSSSSAFGASTNGAPPPSSGDRLLAEADAGHHPGKILNLDLRGAVKSHVHGVRRTISKRRNDAKDKDEENRRMLFEVSNAIDDKRLEVEALEHRVRSAEEEFEKTKDNATTQKLNSDAQIERAEKELAKMRAGLSESVQLMEQRELNAQFQYEQLTVRAHALREELHTEIDRILHDICKFKMHVQDSLEGYESLVVDELDQELGTAEALVSEKGLLPKAEEELLIDIEMGDGQATDEKKEEDAE